MGRTVAFDEAGAIQRAMEVFWKKGYNATSLRDLTDAMKINSSSLYNTIGDKQELFLKCVERYTEMRRADLNDLLRNEDSPFEALVRYIDDAVQTLISGEGSCLAVKTTFELGANDPRVQAVLKADSDYSYAFLAKLIRRAIEAGEIVTDEEPDLLADYFISTWTGWNESFILHKDPVKIKRMAAFFIRQLSK